jgi:hypothetical protein
VVFPRYGTGSAYSTVATIAVVVALLGVIVNEWRLWRAMQGMARDAFRRGAV